MTFLSFPGSGPETRLLMITLLSSRLNLSDGWVRPATPGGREGSRLTLETDRTCRNLFDIASFLCYHLGYSRKRPTTYSR
jgi:hypothetical protein